MLGRIESPVDVPQSDECGWSFKSGQMVLFRLQPPRPSVLPASRWADGALH